MALEYAEEKIPTSPRLPEKLSEKPWFDVNVPFSCLVTGEPRSGKTKLIDWMIQTFYQNGFFTWWMFSALGFENLYPAVNKNCKLRWQLELEKNPERGYELPSCQCYDYLPVLWMIPDYIEFDEKTLDKFNGVYWRSWFEYNEVRLKGYIHEYIPPWRADPKNKEDFIDVTKWKKPKELQPKVQPLKIMKYKPPRIISDTTTKFIPEFRADFKEIVKTAKKEKRLLVNSPSIHPATPQGRREKYAVPAEGLRYIQEDLWRDDEVFFQIEKPKDEWEASNHKKALVSTEFRAMCPSSKFSGEKESTISKRAWYNFMPERRHSISWVTADAQSPSDIFDGVRMQFSELKIFKKTTFELIGEENRDFYKHVETIFENKIERDFELNPEGYIPKEVKLLLLQRGVCRLTELPVNYMMIRIPNGEAILRQVQDAFFHHKSDIADNFNKIFGFRWKIAESEQDQAGLDQSPKQSSFKLKKEAKDTIFRWIDTKRAEKLGYPEILSELKKLVANGTFMATGLENLDHKHISNRFNEWKKKLA